MAAAVSDHRLSRSNPGKLTKSALQQQFLQPSCWEIVPDLLHEMVQKRPKGQVLVGFCAYSGEGLDQAQQKLQEKGCDLLFANPIDQANAGFEALTNQGWLLQQGQEPLRLGPGSKLTIGHQLLNHWHKCWR
jgi:phosphopantothenoylcysteine decarboxylase/phosphopantothenate--cysteine ligase